MMSKKKARKLAKQIETWYKQERKGSYCPEDLEHRFGLTPEQARSVFCFLTEVEKQPKLKHLDPEVDGYGTLYWDSVTYVSVSTEGVQRALLMKTS